MSSLEGLDFYTIGNYDQLCEEHFRIKKIIPIKKTCSKTILNIVLNIITFGIIQLIYGIMMKNIISKKKNNSIYLK